jgi:phage recombination protein Bet
MGKALKRRDEVAGLVAMTDELKELIRAQVGGAAKLSDQELVFYAAFCRGKGVDPLSRLILPLRIGGRLTFHATIDYLRSRAASSGLFAGSEVDVTEWSGEAGASAPVAARATVYRLNPHTHERYPTSAIAYWREYARPAAEAWKQYPSVMLAKCAEALALRRAFPEVLHGLYTAEELRVESVAEVDGKAEEARAEVEADLGQMLARPKPAAKEAAPQTEAPANDDPRKALVFACLRRKINRYAALAFTYQTLSSQVLTDEEVRDVVKLVSAGTLDTRYRATDKKHDDLVQAIIALAEIQDAQSGGDQEGRADRIQARLAEVLGEGWTAMATDALQALALQRLCADQDARRAKAVEDFANSVKAAWWAAQKREAPGANVAKAKCKEAMEHYAGCIGKPLADWGIGEWRGAKTALELGLVDVLTGEPRGQEESTDDGDVA